MNDKAIYPIRFVSQQTGLSAHVIRAWERRYGAIRPQRTATKRRIYTKTDLMRLKLLCDGVAAGNTIAQIAGLENEVLAEMATTNGHQTGYVKMSATKSNPTLQPDVCPQEFVSAAVDILKELDPGALEAIIDQASVALPRLVLVEKVILPLIEKIGLLWATGEIKIIHEHLASLVLRHFLWEMLRSTKTASNAPMVIGATPVDQWHEFGSMIAMILAGDSGWRSCYCGVNLPAEEIASAAAQKQARASILSIVQPADCNHLKREVRRLRRILPQNCTLIICGSGAEAIRSIVNGTDVIMTNTLQDLRFILHDLSCSGNSDISKKQHHCISELLGFQL